MLEDRQADRPLDRRRVNGRLRAQRYDDLCPFGKCHRPFKHDNAVLNSPKDFHAVIINSRDARIKADAPEAAVMDLDILGTCWFVCGSLPSLRTFPASMLPLRSAFDQAQ